MQPLVSIITPCLNAGRHLRRCLASVARQTYERIEHVVVDGGSTDDTPNLLEEAHAGPWISEPDRGQSDAIRKGLDLAQGSVVGWLNADDELLPRAVSEFVARLSADPGLGWVYGRGVILNVDGSRSIEPVSKVSDRDLGFGNPIVQPSTLIRRDALDASGGIDEQFHLAMDLDLWLRLVDHGIRRDFTRLVLAKMSYDEASKTGGLPRSAFLREEFLVYLKNGRPGAAHLALAGAAAYDAMSERHIADEALERRVSEAYEWGREHMADLDRNLLQTLAPVQACFAELRSGGASFNRLRVLWRPEVWRDPVAAARIRHGLTRKLQNAARRPFVQRAHRPDG